MLVRQLQDASGNTLGLSWDDVSTFASGIINNAQTAAADVCKLAPAGQLVAGAAGSGSVQQALQTVNSICGNQPVGAAAAANPQYPTTCIKRFNTSHNTWTVYCPAGVHANYGFGGWSDDGTIPVSPAIPSGTTPIATSLPTEPTGATAGGTEKDMPWYKNWKYLVPIAGGVVVAGVAVHHFRKKK